MSSVGCATLAAALERPDGDGILETLDWGNNCIDGPALAAALRGLPRLVKLDLGGARGYEEDLVPIARVLSTLSKLEVLDLSENSLEHESTFELAAALPHLSALRSLRLDTAFDVGDRGMRLLAGALMRGHCPHLETFHVIYCGVSDGGALALANALVKRSWLFTPGAHPLADIDLSQNHNITPRGGRALATALANTCPHLQHLDLSHNSDMGLTPVTEFLRLAIRHGGPRLKSLSLDNINSVCEAETQAFADAFSAAASAGIFEDLKRLSMYGTGISTQKNLLAAVEHLTSLRELYLMSTRMNDGGAKVLAAALRKVLMSETYSSWPTQLYVWLGRNKITDEGAHALVDAMCKLASGSSVKLRMHMNFDENPCMTDAGIAQAEAKAKSCGGLGVKLSRGHLYDNYDKDD